MFLFCSPVCSLLLPCLALLPYLCHWTPLVLVVSRPVNTPRAKSFARTAPRRFGFSCPVVHALVDCMGSADRSLKPSAQSSTDS